MQEASRPPSLGHPHNRGRVLFILFVSLTLLLLVVSPSHAQTSGLTCTISASAKGFDASFSGAISGSASIPNWTLYFGDGRSDSGSGASVSDSHTYGNLGTYTVTLAATGQSFTGGPLAGSCSTRVTIRTTYSVSVQDGFTASDQATYVPPLSVGDSVSISDKTGNYIPLAVGDAASIGDTPVLTGPGHFNEFTNLSDSAVVTLASSGAVTQVVLLTVVVVSVVVTAVAVWVLLMMRPGR